MTVTLHVLEIITSKARKPRILREFDEILVDRHGKTCKYSSFIWLSKAGIHILKPAQATSKIEINNRKYFSHSYNGEYTFPSVLHKLHIGDRYIEREALTGYHAVRGDIMRTMTYTITEIEK